MGAIAPAISAIAQVGAAGAAAYGAYTQKEASDKANELTQKGIDEQNKARQEMQDEQNRQGSEAVQFNPNQTSIEEEQRRRLRNRGLSSTMYGSNRFNLLGGGNDGLLGG